MYAVTAGYPYFIQAYGKVAWDVAPASPITVEDVRVAAPEAEAELAVGFFGSRYERAAPAEREYLRAMADAAHEGDAAMVDKLGRSPQVRVRHTGRTPSRCRPPPWRPCSTASRSPCHRPGTRCSRRD